MSDQSRMPMPAYQDLTGSQREAADEVRQGPRGELTGPFVALLRCPDLLRRVQAVGAQLRFSDLAIDPAVRELAILVVARHWAQEFEWAHHRPLAVAAEVPDSTCEALLAGESPTGLSPDLDIAYRLMVELQTTRAVADDTYRLSVDRFGEAGVVELTTIAGYYTTLAMIMNMAQAPPPEPVAFGSDTGWLSVRDPQAP